MFKVVTNKNVNRQITKCEIIYKYYNILGVWDVEKKKHLFKNKSKIKVNK